MDQINHVAQEMRDNFQVTRAELANMMAVLQDKEARAGTVATADSTNPSEENYYSTTESANSVAESATQLEILKLLQSMQLELKTIRASIPRTVVYKKTPDNPNFTWRITRDYCWTHGLSAHKSAECRAKAKCHKDAATTDNKMNGSKAFCP